MTYFTEKADLLNVMANASRLQVLTTLRDGEMGVGKLAETVGLSQSALSQHLAKLRAMDLVSTRRDAQAVYYSVKSDRVYAVLDMLSDLFDETIEVRSLIAS
ncbi:MULTISPECIES: ArsR/SmtB family transcription factor [unclassified Rhizobium]|jgi:DNA-binding transcriptional ArsR family regulator|uniref:ArsR/SmtB family transcription factor n=1 Tax=unclassified Rhizobium TaxID=2613769 RepID=UPI000DD7038F|nr:metalloregulator ArsR/SmtB family transcription factor [Rhizobium sp. AN80A]